jgi:hypothetical protein
VLEVYSEYDWFWFLICAIAAAALSIWFYPLRNPSSYASPFFLHVKRILRFLTLFILFCLLLNPLLKYKKKEVLKPTIVFYVDDSESVFLSDSVSASKLNAKVDELNKQLKEKYDTKVFYFDGNVKDTSGGFKGKSTDLSATIKHANIFLKEKNPAAVCVFSDGVFTKGMQPTYTPANFQAPVFTVGMGSTIPVSDIAIKEVNTNSIAYLNNSFAVKVILQQQGFFNQEIRLQVYDGDKMVQSKNIKVPNSNLFEDEFILEAKSPGIRKYSVKILPLQNELSKENNKFDFYVEVLDNRQKIALVYKSPHPDVNALLASLEYNKNYECTVFSSADFISKSNTAYDLIIGHQFPSNDREASWVRETQKNNSSFWFILGSQIDADRLHTFLPDIKIQRKTQAFNEVQVFPSSDFNAFLFSPELLEEQINWPPLRAPFGNIYFSNPMQVQSMQSVQRINSGQPLMAFTNTSELKYAYLLGEGIWRWRVQNIKMQGNSELFDEWVLKNTQYLLAREKKQRLKVYTSKERYDEEESIRFLGELYDQSYNAVKESEIIVKFKNEKGKVFSLRLSWDGVQYSANAGALPSGYYTFVGSVPSMPELKPKEGGFLVFPLQAEQIQIQANHSELQSWAHKNNGSYLPFVKADQLLDSIKTNTNTSELIREKTKLEKILQLEWLLYLLVASLGLEWFLRKWEGGF